MESDLPLRLEDRFNEAVVDPSAWVRGLTGICDRLNVFGAVMLPLHGRVPRTIMTGSLEPLVEHYFQEGWVERDLRNRAMPKMVRDGLVVDQEVFDRSEMTRSPYWQDFLGKHNLEWFCGLRVQAGQDLWCLALQRTPDQGAFTTEEQTLLRSLIPVMSRSATLLNQIGHARIEGATDALAMIAIPALVLGRQGHVLHVNGAFDTLIGADIALRQSRIVVPGRPDIALALRRHFDAVIGSDLRRDPSTSEGVVVPRAGRRPLFVQARRITGALNECFSPGRALVTFSSLDGVRGPPRHALRSMFSLTDSESRLVQALGQGRTLTSAAHYMNISHETARSYLKSIFSKTGVRSQNEIVLLSARLALLP